VTKWPTSSSGISLEMMVWKLPHLQQFVRPDIGTLAAYNSAPTDAHFAAMLDVIQCVGSTAERGITCGQLTVPVAI
jgi:hypothetical protein